MAWIDQFQLVLFDFDGLLVDTERVHFEAYRRMVAGRGYDLAWTFSRYCKAAHFSATALEEQIYAEFPGLQQTEPDWSVLYAEKKQAYIDLLHERPVPLMPGAELVLKYLEGSGVRHCVVTHSARQLIDVIRQQQPLLNTIPHWYTREDYDQPKPASDGYIKAIDALGQPGDRVVGFEDSPRGLQSLLGTDAEPVMVCESGYPGEALAQEHERVKIMRCIADAVS